MMDILKDNPMSRFASGFFYPFQSLRFVYRNPKLPKYVLIPFLIVLNKWILYFTIIVMALVIGFLYNFLILDIKLLGKQHHIAAGIIVPLIALANVFLMVIVSNRFIADLQLNNPPHNPAVVGVVFGVAFILPYLVDRLRGKHHFHHKVQ